MSDSSLSETVVQRPSLSARQSLVDLSLVFVISAIVFVLERTLDQYGIVQVSEAASGFSAVLAGFITALALVFIRRQDLREIGFRAPRSWKTVPFWVVGIFVVFVVAQVALPGIIGQFFELPATDLSRYDTLHKNLPAVIMMALLLPITASIPEEVIYRGFLMDRLTRIFGESRSALVLVVLCQSLVFGLIHFQWGVGGVITTMLMGAVWGTAFLLTGRNLWIVIMAHSLGHIVMIVQLYFVKGSELAA